MDSSGIQHALFRSTSFFLTGFITAFIVSKFLFKKPKKLRNAPIAQIPVVDEKEHVGIPTGVVATQPPSYPLSRLDTIFLPDIPGICSHYFRFDDEPCKYTDCKYKHEESNAHRIWGLVERARSQVSIAAHVITNFNLFRRLMDLSRRGVSVRIIRDSSCLKLSDSFQLNSILQQRIAESGILIIDNSMGKGESMRRSERLPLQHHKFIVIDRRLVITGSANMTMQAYNGNFEDVLLIEDAEVVKKYSDHFELLWETFCDSLYR